MSKTEATIDEIRRNVGKAVMLCLNNCKFSDVTFDMIAAETKYSAAIIRRLFPDITQMVGQGLRDLDDDIMSGFAEDIADDVDADIHDRILEGVIVRYEAYRFYKAAIKNLNTAATMNVALASLMIQRLNAVSKTILELSGDDTSGLRGMLKVKGLAGVTLLAQHDWFKDETSDMSATIRVIDQRLKQAKEFGEMLNIISDKQDEDEFEKEQ